MAAATNPFGLTRAFARASHASSLWQLCNTLLLYVLAIALMFASVDVHYAITLLLSFVASVAYLRLFMIGHAATTAATGRSCPGRGRMG